MLANGEIGMALTREDKLILLIEECGEVIQAATKCLRFGYDSNHIPEYGRNDVVLSEEIGDLLAVVDSLDLQDAAVQSTRTAKMRKAELAKEKFGNSRPG